MKVGIDDVRKALSTDFDRVAYCLLPMACAHNMPWSEEEDFLNNLNAAMKTSAGLAGNLLLSTAQSKYALRVEGAKVHKRIWVDFLLRRKPQSCEIGDILIVSKYIDPNGVLSRSVCFLQVKASDKRKRLDTWKIDKRQLGFYVRWPTIQSCYTGLVLTKNVLLQNLKVNHKNRLFSPYLLVGRNWQPGLLCGPSSWITGPDLIAAASHASGIMHGPLELPFLSHLIQLLFQTTGERDILNYKTRNANLKQLVDRLLRYVNLNDPPEGEGRPFLVVTLTVKKIVEAQ